jgi:hypothetical protein
VNVTTKLKNLRDEYKELEAKWLAADAACNQSLQVLRAAQEHYQNAREAEASLLVDAAIVCIENYVCE